MSKPKDAPSAPPAEIIPPAKTGRAKAALAKMGLVDPNAPPRDAELEGLMSEIESDLREEELRKLWQRYGKAFIGLLAVIVIVIAGVQVWRDREADQRQALAASYDHAMKDLQAGKTTEALDGLTKVAGHSGEGYAAIAKLQRAAALLKQNDTDGAVAIYKALAADGSADDTFRQLATLLQVLHTMDREPPNTLEPLLTPMLNPDSPFSASAQELSAVLAAKQGDNARAVKLLDQILEDRSSMPPNLLARATDLRAYYASQLPPASSSPKPPAPAPAKP